MRLTDLWAPSRRRRGERPGRARGTRAAPSRAAGHAAAAGRQHRRHRRPGESDELPDLQRALPAGVTYGRWSADRTATIRASVSDVQFTLLLSMRAGGRRDLTCSCAALARHHDPGVALPLSLIGTFGVMAVGCGYGLDNLSLMALTVGDRLRGRRRHRHDREHRASSSRTARPPLEAAFRGARTDRFHHRLADRLADRRIHPAAVHDRRRRPAVQASSPSPFRAVSVSAAVVSLTLTPMMCARLLRPAAAAPPTRLARLFEPGSAACSPATDAASAGRCGHQRLMLLVAVADPVRHGRCCMWWCRRASCRRRTPGCWSPSPRPEQKHQHRPYGRSCRRARRRSSRTTRRWPTSAASSARAR